MLKNISIPIQEIVNRKRGIPLESKTQLSPAIIGRVCERVASKFLKKYGYTIVDQNWRCRTGELDIVARHLDTLIIVEVKARLAKSNFRVRDSVSQDKLKQLYTTAKHYLYEHRDLRHHRHVRFDVVRIGYSVSTCGNLNCTLEHVTNVIPYGIEEFTPKKTYIRW